MATLWKGKEVPGRMPPFLSLLISGHLRHGRRKPSELGTHAFNMIDPTVTQPSPLMSGTWRGCGCQPFTAFLRESLIAFPTSSPCNTHNRKPGRKEPGCQSSSALRKPSDLQNLRPLTIDVPHWHTPMHKQPAASTPEHSHY